MIIVLGYFLLKTQKKLRLNLTNLLTTTSILILQKNISTDIIPIMIKLYTWPTDLYCNSGTTVINVKKYKEVDTCDSLYESFISYAGKLNFPDQDFLNIHFHGKIQFLTQEYNSIMADYFRHPRYKLILVAGKILHFTHKPWKWSTNSRIQRAFLKYSIDKTVKKQVQKAMIKGFFIKPVYILLRQFPPLRLLKKKILG